MTTKLIRAATVGAIATSLLAACAGDPVADSSVEPTGPTCAELASDTAQAHGDRVFVEAGGAQYTVDAVRTLSDNRVIVETTVDQPDLVGYPQVQFLSECSGEEVVLLGGYVPIDGNFELLFTTNEGSDSGDVPMLAP